MTSGHITCTTTLSSSDLSYISLCQIESLSSHLNESTYPPLPVDESSLNEHTHLLTECCVLRVARRFFEGLYVPLMYVQFYSRGTGPTHIVEIMLG